MNARRSGVWAEINTNALRHNIKVIRSMLCPHVKMMIVLKSNAYGHGLLSTAKTVVEAGADALGVVDLAEAIQLRESGINLPILLMSSPDTVEGVQTIASLGIDVSCSSLQDIQLLQQSIDDTTSCKVHLKIDTGMHRLGCCPDKAPILAHQITARRSTRLVALYSHISDTSNVAEVYRQDRIFRESVSLTRESVCDPLFLHLANSAGALAYPHIHYDMVRVGLSIYGLNPFHPLTSGIPELVPVLTLKTRVIHLSEAAVGESVGYGKKFLATRPTRIAVLEGGYACGVPRGVSGKLPVLWRGLQLPQIGLVMMNHMLVDCTDAPMLKVGEEVILIGQDAECQITAWDWAQATGSIPWEILARLPSNIDRVHLARGIGELG